MVGAKKLIIKNKNKNEKQRNNLSGFKSRRSVSRIRLGLGYHNINRGLNVPLRKEVNNMRMTTKEKVLYCLKKYPKTRNSDTSLLRHIWFEYHRQYLKKDRNNRYYILLEDLGEVPNQDEVKRWRAKIQNPNPKIGYKGKYYPTDKKIAILRGWQEEKWRKALGYNPENRKEY